MPGIAIGVLAQNGTGSNYGPLDWTVIGVDDICQNVRMILATPIGSQYLNRLFGIDYSFLDLPINMAIPLFISQCVQQIPQWEPRARYKTLTWKATLDGTINATVVIQPNWNVSGNTATQPFPQLIL